MDNNNILVISAFDDLVGSIEFGLKTTRRRFRKPAGKQPTSANLLESLASNLFESKTRRKGRRKISSRRNAFEESKGLYAGARTLSRGLMEETILERTRTTQNHPSQDDLVMFSIYLLVPDPTPCPRWSAPFFCFEHERNIFRLLHAAAMDIPVGCNT